MKPVTIIGGGLSGLCLGIGLRQREVPVQIIEAGTYPRHKVCGEFLSGQGREILTKLGITPKLAGAREALDATFSLGPRTTKVRTLPSPALCISRWKMDAALAEMFTALGGKLITSQRAPSAPAEGTIRATGRRPQAEESGWRLFGLKAHALGITLRAGLEMHFTPSGYVGLCAVEDGRVNVCGLFRSREPVPTLARDWRDWLTGTPGSALRERLANAVWDDSSFSSVAALALAPRSAKLSGELSIGDAVTMIPPVTGNGMSMACESAVTAIEPLTAWSQNAAPWEATCHTIARKLDARFSARLRFAALLQRTILQPSARFALFQTMRLFPQLQNALFRLTR